MANPVSVESVARHLKVPLGDIESMLAKGWLTAVVRDGMTFLDGHQEYIARFILELRKRKSLDDAQVSYVLDQQRPPYSFDQVDRILAEQARA